MQEDSDFCKVCSWMRHTAVLGTCVLSLVLAQINMLHVINLVFAQINMLHVALIP